MNILMIRFKNDENGYMAWLAEHPEGYVLNVRKEPDPKYVVLHSASCGSISSTKRADGAYTERSYNKWCADSIEILRKAAKREGRSDGTFSKRCGLCCP